MDRFLIKLPKRTEDTNENADEGTSTTTAETTETAISQYPDEFEEGYLIDKQSERSTIDTESILGLIPSETSSVFTSGKKRK